MKVFILRPAGLLYGKLTYCIALVLQDNVKKFSFSFAYNKFKETFGIPPLGSLIAQKMKFSIKHFFSKYDQIRRKLRIWSHLLKKSLMEISIFVQ